MSGRSSKAKGTRAEYLVRDYFRSLGMKADRVPSSGAAQGFPGDVKVYAHDGTSFLVEVKSRQSSFKSVYEMFKRPFMNLLINEKLVIIADSYDGLYNSNTMFMAFGVYKILPRVANKILTMEQWVKGSDILMIKDNNKPFLFIRYLK